MFAVKAVLRALCALYAGSSPDGPRGSGVWVYADLHGYAPSPLPAVALRTPAR